MQITGTQKRIIEQVVNVFETGRPLGDYAALVVLSDGPHGIRQITYGRSQTTEYGNLRDLLTRYVEAQGRFAADLKPYLSRLKREPLTNDIRFRHLLRRAGADPAMQRTQDAFFDARYFRPAQAWAETRGFKLPLSLLVIYDSFIHSGGILSFLRSRFPEMPPSFGGEEKAWIRAYLRERREWLAGHSNLLLRKTIYRLDALLEAVRENNWELTLPIAANGVLVR